MTDTMRAIVLDAPGPPDALTIRELQFDAGGWLGADRGQCARAEPVRVAYPPGPRIGVEFPRFWASRLPASPPVPGRGVPHRPQVATMLGGMGRRSTGLRRVHLRPGAPGGPVHK